MKKYLSILFLLLLAIPFVSIAQLRKIPAEATEAFKQQYPSAKDVEWKDKLTGYTADFKLGDTSFTATFNNDGEWVSTENEIQEPDLPAVVKDSYEKSKYSDWEIGHVDKIVLPGDEVHYRIQAVKSEIRKQNLYYSSDGHLLKDKITL